MDTEALNPGGHHMIMPVSHNDDDILSSSSPSAGPSRPSPRQKPAELSLNGSPSNIFIGGYSVDIRTLLASSSVSFPSSTEAAEPSLRSVIPPRFLPFRRISLPANSEPPIYKHRESVVSMHSFDSLPEEPRPQGSTAPTPTTPSKKPRPTSLQPPPRVKQRAESRRRRTEIISSHEKEGKRRSIVAEILDTERTYVEGLDLIYDVSKPVPPVSLPPLSLTAVAAFPSSPGRFSRRACPDSYTNRAQLHICQLY